MNKLQRSDNELEEITRRKRRIMQDLRELQEKEVELQILVRTLQSRNELTLDEDSWLAFQTTINTCYESIGKNRGDSWADRSEDYSLQALTKPIVMVEEGVISAPVGKFLVTIDKAGNLSYKREDGRVVKRSSYSSVVAPHCTGNICWGNYRELVTNAQREGDYCQLLLLTHAHLCCVNPHDCYMHLYDYVKKLRIQGARNLATNLLIDPYTGNDIPEETVPVFAIPIEIPDNPVPVMIEVPPPSEEEVTLVTSEPRVTTASSSLEIEEVPIEEVTLNVPTLFINGAPVTSNVTHPQVQINSDDAEMLESSDI